MSRLVLSLSYRVDLGLVFCLGSNLPMVHKIPPVYIGEVLRRGTQNPSYIYRRDFA